MATRDQALFLETYLGLKRALKRKLYDSDSDSDIDHSTNRGNKLKKRARFVREGKLGAADGSSMFTEMVEHAGYRRKVISRNPPLVDEDGYEIESDEDEEDIQEAVAAAADEDPYSGIHLEQLLAPLTSVTDLPNHPSMSRPYTSKAITELAKQGCNWMHKENNTLWKVKPLLTKLCGDHNWVDCRLLLTPDDVTLFDDVLMTQHATADREKRNERPVNGAANGAAVNGVNGAGKVNGINEVNGVNGTVNGMTSGAVNGVTNGNSVYEDRDTQVEAADRTSTDVEAMLEELDDDDENGYIHPLYLAPRVAHPEQNAGLPEHEAEDVRRLLQLWVQKQEEVARGSRKLYEGLLRADRLRKTVLLWSKAEANRDLSDGEDYYDWDTWGLTEELKKGYDEEEEDLQQTHKKTRNRK